MQQTADKVHGPHVTVVVLHWSGVEHTLKCLECLSTQAVPNGVVVDVLVIDNGSADCDREAFAVANAGMRLLALQENTGFAEGMNVGIRDALTRGVDFVWLLNNDAFVEPSCLGHLMTAMEALPTLMIATPRLLSLDGNEQPVGGRVDWASGETGECNADALRGPAVSGTWVAGTAPLIRTSALHTAGLLDPQFFAYWEDIDLSTRVVRSGGDMRAVSEAVAYHVGGASSGGPMSPLSQFLFVRNGLFFLRKNAPSRQRAAALLRFSARSLGNAGLLRMQGQYAAADAIVNAMIAALLGRLGKPLMPSRASRAGRLLAAHPWQIQKVLGWLADLLDFAKGNNSRDHVRGSRSRRGHTRT